MNPSHHKSIIYEKCIEILTNKIQDMKNQISELNKSFENESKSSAGDKHETARAMAQLESEKLHQQLHQTESNLAILQKIDSNKKHETIQLGSLVQTSQGIFYLTIALGKIDEIMIISLGSPIGKLFIGKSSNEIIHFNNIEYKILSVN